MTAERPLSRPAEYVQEHRDDLMYLLRRGDPTIRALALYVLLEGGERNDWELVEREVELAQELGEDVLQNVRD